MEKRKAVSAINVLLMAFFVVFMVIPLGRMLMEIGNTDISRFIGSRRFMQAIGNTLRVAGVTTLISVSLGMLLAYLLERLHVRGKRMWMLVFAFPMLIPSISHGMGLIALLGANGILTRLLSLKTNIYGFGGIVAGSVLYSFPVAFLMMVDVIRYEDSTSYEAAEVLGISRTNQLLSITIPYMRKPLLSASFAVFTMVAIDYGVPLMVGGQYVTLSVMMYQDVIGLLDFGKGSFIGLVLLVPAFFAFILDILNKEQGNASFVTKPFQPVPKRGRDMLATAFCVVVGFLVVLPLITFCFQTIVRKYPIDMTFTLDNIKRAFAMNAGAYLRNSLIISLLVSAIGVVMAFVAGYITARMRSKAATVVHLLSISSLAVPGIVLGLSYVLLFSGTALYGTLAILVFANLIHFFASPYLMMYNIMGKLNPHLETVGKTCGVSRLWIVLDVILPLSKGTIVEAFAYFFVNSMMTISAVVFLSNTSTKPLSIMITMFEANMMLECAAFVSLMIFVVNIFIKSLANTYKSRLEKGG